MSMSMSLSLQQLIDVEYAPGEAGYDTASGYKKRIPKRAKGLEYASHRFKAVDIDNLRIDQAG